MLCARTRMRSVPMLNSLVIGVRNWAGTSICAGTVKFKWHGNGWASFSIEFYLFFLPKIPSRASCSQVWKKSGIRAIFPRKGEQSCYVWTGATYNKSCLKSFKTYITYFRKAELRRCRALRISNRRRKASRQLCSNLAVLHGPTTYIHTNSC